MQVASTVRIDALLLGHLWWEVLDGAQLAGNKRFERACAPIADFCNYR
jgi:hypothetical protein